MDTIRTDIIFLRMILSHRCKSDVIIVKEPAFLRAPHRKWEYIMFMQKSCNKPQESLLSVKRISDVSITPGLAIVKTYIGY